MLRLGAETHKQLQLVFEMPWGLQKSQVMEGFFILLLYYLFLSPLKLKFKQNKHVLVLFMGIFVGNWYITRLLVETYDLKDWTSLVFCRHEKYLTQYRAVFVVNCKVEDKQVLKLNISRSRKKSRSTERFDGSNALSTSNETFKQVCCSVCSTEVGVIDEDEVYHFFNVLPSESWLIHMYLPSS